MVGRPTCDATLSLTLRFIKTEDRPLYFNANGFVLMGM